MFANQRTATSHYLMVVSSFLCGAAISYFYFHRTTSSSLLGKPHFPCNNEYAKNKPSSDTERKENSKEGLKTEKDTSPSTGVVMIVQRVRSASLLQNNTVASFGTPQSLIEPPPNSSWCSAGMIIYISFSKDATEDLLFKAAMTILNLPILTLGHWGDPNGKKYSTLQLATHLHQNKGSNTSNKEGVTLMIVPQANLISKVKQLGKSIQYHNQIPKSKAELYYQTFIKYLNMLSLEHQLITKSSLNQQHLSPSLQKEIQSAYALSGIPRTFTTPNRKQEKLLPDVPPAEMFLNDTSYATYDSKGFPLTTSNGEVLNKSLVKKLTKMYNSQKKRYDKYLEKQKLSGNGDDLNDGQHNGDKIESSIASFNDDTNGVNTNYSVEKLEPEFINIVSGVFGTRQGLEFHSDMGPFCHVLFI